MTAAAVADRLGFTLAHIYELARAGKIKSLRQGKDVRFTEAALLEYIASIGSPADTELLVKAGRGAGRKN
jgi:excisionase family DNA binding protein